MVESGTISGNENGEVSNDPSVTRRQFVGSAAGAAAVTAAGGFATTATAADTTETPSTLDTIEQYPAHGEPPYGAARISPEGYRELAEAERKQKQKGNTLKFDKKVDGVKDLGLDPSGKEPIEPILNSKIESGMLVVLPYGDYKATGEVRPGVDGKFGIVGEGYQKSKKPPKPGKNSVVIKVETSDPIHLINIGPLDAGLFGNFVVDQRAPRSHGAVQVESSGNVRVRDIRTVGAQTQVTGADDNPGFFAPLAKGNDSLVVFERCIARGGGIPGTKNIGGSYGVGIFGRQGKRGMVVLKDCVIENMPDNGIYGARTKATVRVLGGLYRNNDVNQVRVNGDAIVKGVDVIIDEKHYTGLKSKSYGRERGPGWPAANGIKVETDEDIIQNTGTVIKNCNIVGASVSDKSHTAALIYVWGSGGATTAENCRITNNIAEAKSVIAQKPGSGNDPAPPQPWRFVLKNSVVKGKAAGKGGPAVAISGRQRSLMTNTCFKYPGANRGDIEGAGISNCGFGKQCKSAGLKAPKKVGSGGNLSSIPVNVSYNGSVPASGAKSEWKPSNKAMGAGAGSTFVAIFGGIIGGLGIFALMIFVIPVLAMLALAWGVLGD